MLLNFFSLNSKWLKKNKNNKMFDNLLFQEQFKYLKTYVCFRIRNNSYHTTSIKPAPEWLGFGKVLGIIKTTAAKAFSTINLWEITIEVSICAVIVFVYAFVGISVIKIMTMDIVNLYNQIAMNPDLVDFLNTTYPDLTEFNKCSMELLKEKSLSQLSYAECEIIVKFCVYTKKHMISGILIDPTNQLLL